MSLTAPTSLFHTRVALFLALAMAGVVGSALAFQYVGGYIPCKLCLEQRWPYYIGAPLMALAALSAATLAAHPRAACDRCGADGLTASISASIIPASNGHSGRGRQTAPPSVKH